MGIVSFICTRRGQLNVTCIGGGQGGGGEGGSLISGEKAYGGKGGNGDNIYIKVNGIQQIFANGGNSASAGGWGGSNDANGDAGYKGNDGQIIFNIINLQKNDTVIIGVGGGGGDGGNSGTNGNPGGNGTDTYNGSTGGGVYQCTVGSNGNGTNNGIGGNPGTWSSIGGKGGKCGKILLSGTAKLI